MQSTRQLSRLSSFKFTETRKGQILRCYVDVINRLVSLSKKPKVKMILSLISSVGDVIITRQPFVDRNNLPTSTAYGELASSKWNENSSGARFRSNCFDAI